MKSQVKIFAGETRVIGVNIVEEDSLVPYDLTGATELTVCLKKQDGETLQLTQTGGKVNIIDEKLGQINFTLDATDSDSLKIGEDQHVEVEIEKATETRIVQIKSSLTVERRICQ